MIFDSGVSCFIDGHQQTALNGLTMQKLKIGADQTLKNVLISFSRTASQPACALRGHDFISQTVQDGSMNKGNYYRVVIIGAPRSIKNLRQLDQGLDRILVRVRQFVLLGSLLVFDEGRLR